MRRFSLATCAIWLGCVLGGLPTAEATPPIPAPPQGRPIAIVGATLHSAVRPPDTGATLLFVDGKITALGKNVALPDDVERVDAAGKHVYPGLFDAYSQLGLVEIPAVRATVDRSEVGRLNPNVRAWMAINPDSEVIPVSRSAGVLLALVAPTGGLMAGRSAVVQLDGWTYEDMTLAADVALHIDWPRMTPGRRQRTDKELADFARELAEQLEELDRIFDDAAAYRQAREANPTAAPRDLRLESLAPVLDRRRAVIVAADGRAEIEAACEWAERRRLKLLVFGGYDAPLCADRLKRLEAGVIVAGVHRLPQRRDDPYDHPYTVPARLRAAGVPFCIAGFERFEPANQRNLPLHAATAIAFGLERDDALRAITLWPAELLGVAERVGSLEVGKQATLIVADGDIFQPATRVEAAYIGGRRLDLDDRHKALFRKYEEKLRRLEAEP